jgi:hypothetical protein
MTTRNSRSMMTSLMSLLVTGIAVVLVLLPNVFSPAV